MNRQGGRQDESRSGKRFVYFSNFPAMTRSGEGREEDLLFIIIPLPEPVRTYPTQPETSPPYSRQRFSKMTRDT
jgi:hypothetical protein